MTALWQRMAEELCEYDIEREPDGEGGWRTSRNVGRTFSGTLATSTRGECEQAGTSASAATLTLTTAPGECPAFGTEFYRLSDYARFRVTSAPADMATPSVTTFSFEQATCEAVGR